MFLEKNLPGIYRVAHEMVRHFVRHPVLPSFFNVVLNVFSVFKMKPFKE